MDSNMIWIIVIIVMLVIEIATLGLTSIWFSGGALLALIASALHAPLSVQILLFVVGSVLLLILTRPIALKYFNKSRVKTNAEGLIGTQGVVISPIDNLKGEGQVKISGMEWSAKSVDSNKKYEIGDVVNIVDIVGVKLIVDKKEDL